MKGMKRNTAGLVLCFAAAFSSVHAQERAQTPSDLEVRLKAALEASERRSGADDPVRIQALVNWATFLDAQNRDPEALAAWQTLLRFVEERYGPQNYEVSSALMLLSGQRFKAGEYAEMLPLLDRSLYIRETAVGPDSLEVVEVLRVRVGALTGAGQVAEAVDDQERVSSILAARQAAHPDLARAFFEAGMGRAAIRQFDRAHALLVRSLRHVEQQAISNTFEEAQVCSEIARVLVEMSRFGEAQVYSERSVRIREHHAAQDPVSLAGELNDLAVIRSELGDYVQSNLLHRRVMQIAEQHHGPDHPELELPLRNLAHSHRRLGEFDQAVAAFRRSIAIREEIGDANHVRLAIGLAGLAVTLSEAGDDANAIPLHRRALAIYQRESGPESTDVAVSMSSLALALQRTGEFEEALRLHQDGLAILGRTSSNELALARSLLNLGSFYSLMGLAEQGLVPTQRAFDIEMRLLGPEHPSAAMTLNNLAVTFAELGRNEDAFSAQQRALSMLESSMGTEHPVVATALDNMGHKFLLDGDSARARMYFGRALAIRTARFGPEHIITAQSLLNIGMSHVSAKDSEAALPKLERAVRILTSTPQAEAFGEALSAMSLAYLLMERFDVATFWGKEAVNAVQGSRARQRSLDAAMQDAFMGKLQWRYGYLADLLVMQDRVAEAQQVLQMFKEQELFEFLQRSGATDARATRSELTGLERQKFGRFYELQDSQAALATERQRLETQRATRTLSAVERQRLDDIVNRQLPIASRAMQAFFDALEREPSTSQRAPPPQEARLRQTQLTQAVGQLALSEPAARAVGLQYVATDTRLSIILTVPGGPPIARQVSVGRSELSNLVTLFATQLDKRADLPLLLETAQKLHELLIAPIEADLRAARAHTLMLSLTGSLRQLPFAALHDGQRFLLENYTLTLFNEAAGQSLQKAPDSDWRVAGMGLSGAVDGLPALTSVREEVANVVRTPADAYLDGRFTKAQFQASLSGGYNVLHLASHFVFKAGQPHQSWLYLGDKSRLTLADIVRDRMDFRQIELVMLSACDTARGGGWEADGREMESLAARAQMQGAQAVVATLWRVSDASTSHLMQQFYRPSASAGPKSKAARLRASQLAMVSSAGPWSHPYHWAPFVLMGNWR